MRYSTDDMRNYAKPLDNIDLSIGGVAVALKEAADEIDRLRAALLTVTVNLRRGTGTQDMIEYVDAILRT